MQVGRDRESRGAIRFALVTHHYCVRLVFVRKLPLLATGM
jgi:hypothetical protein